MDEVRRFEFSCFQLINVVMLQVGYDALATDLTLIYWHWRSSAMAYKRLLGSVTKSASCVQVIMFSQLVRLLCNAV